jgi:GIY-YIG catalytic domain
MIPIFIYALVSTRDTSPRYVGQSVRVFDRLKVHLAAARPGRGAATSEKAVRDWIRRERNDKFNIEARFLEECPDKQTADRQESYWIEELRSRGFQLTNENKGPGKRT